MSHINTNKLNESDLLGKIDGHLQDALAAADDPDHAVDEYNAKSKSPLDVLDRKFKALEEKIDTANFERHLKEAQAPTPTGAPLNISGGGDAIDGLDAYRNLLDENLAALMSKWADAPYDAKSVDFSAEATNLANILQNKINLEGQLAANQTVVQQLKGLGAQLAAARVSGNFTEISRIEHEIGRRFEQMPAPPAPPRSDGKGGFLPPQTAPKPEILYTTQPVAGNGGFGVDPYGFPYTYSREAYTQEALVRRWNGQEPQHITVDEALNRLIDSTQSTVNSLQGSLSSTVSQIPGQYRNLDNTQLAARIEELRNNTPSGFFARLRPELELNGNPNVQTLEELGAIKEFVQKTKERVTAVMAALARVIGMVGDTLLGVARLQQ